ncbi:divergent polysaccharide deacetylase family protein [Parasedimentitalea maritima]|uniref:Divergent polysaccharide deacetylase family protein n=1 Tax=Parasedimentitalea maritima TaxID=2578117 RepID=A0ABY2UTK2_9RHOB|nr:divergent polysaccharide deacetylase family protein [Zongyanglinia marina]TLP56765.1 divergent polysaccharide deacetylase family protein [Zongyanglinia marina]
MRGFLGGVSIGALVAAAGAAMLSLSAPLPKVVDVAVQPPAGTLEPVDATSAPDEAPGQDADLVEAAPAAPEGEAVDDLSALRDADTQPAARPSVAADDTILTESTDTGDNSTSAPDISLQTDTPVVPVETLPAPALPSQESEIVVSSEPAQPPAPVVVPELATITPPTIAPEITSVGPDNGDTVPSSARSQDIVANPETETAPIAPEVAENATVAAPDVGVDVPVLATPEVGNVPIGTLPSILPTVDNAPAEQLVPGESRGEASGTAEEDAVSERIAALPTTLGAQTRTDGPTIGTPVVPLTERNRLNESGISNGSQDGSPFELYAEPLDNPEGRPLMAIVLIDDENSIGAEALVGFPYPLSFAIDPEDPKAAEKMAARRAAGFEVLVLTNLPREAAPQDAETSLAVWFDTLPETIAVLEGTGTGFQGNRPLADQVSAVAAASGRGLLTQDHGLNTVQKLAARDGIPAAVVFRDFDGAGQNPRAIRRFLDQAAFRAGQEGAVIMLGRVQPDTISALLLWGLQDRATRVALSPVSAALSQQVIDR